MATPQDDSDRGLLPGALLVGAVLAVLAAGAVLSTDAPRSSRSSAPQPAPAPRALEEIPPEDPAPPIPPPVGSDLASRSGEDVRRLGAGSGRYTAQLVVACKPETVERLIRAAGGSDLYVLPAQVKGSACYRVCWGSYASPEEAARAADLPEALRSSDRPRAVEIVSVLP